MQSAWVCRAASTSIYTVPRASWTSCRKLLPCSPALLSLTPSRLCIWMMSPAPLAACPRSNFKLTLQVITAQRELPSTKAVYVDVLSERTFMLCIMYGGPRQAPGLQVRECATALLHVAKRQGVPIFLVGHVTKTGMHLESTSITFS